jgi:hypothetical protein
MKKGICMFEIESCAWDLCKDPRSPAQADEGKAGEPLFESRHSLLWRWWTIVEIDWEKVKLLSMRDWSYETFSGPHRMARNSRSPS